MSEVSTTTSAEHPARSYLHDLPDAWHRVRDDLALACRSARYLWPFVWRDTMDNGVERAWAEGFETGRERERDEAERRMQAPAVGGIYTTARKSLGMTMGELAERAGLGDVQLEEAERGETLLSDAQNFRIARALVEASMERPAAAPS